MVQRAGLCHGSHPSQAGAITISDTITSADRVEHVSHEPWPHRLSLPYSPMCVDCTLGTVTLSSSWIKRMWRFILAVQPGRPSEAQACPAAGVYHKKPQPDHRLCQT
jgi:hypothetical protein